MSGIHAQVAEFLRDAWHENQVTRITWVNHFSAQVVLARDPALLDGFDLVGVDGILLQSLLRTPYARVPGGGDATLPLLLPALEGARVALVGGEPAASEARKSAVQRLLGPRSNIVVSTDGFTGKPSADELPAWVAKHQPDVVIVGMGAGLQDDFALRVAELLPRGVVATCGGWMDQIARTSSYYPKWAYSARLTWAIRVLREPRRLWRRYTLDAVRAFCIRSALLAGVAETKGYRRYGEVARTSTPPPPGYFLTK